MVKEFKLFNSQPLILKAWKQVSEDTIRNFFRKFIDNWVPIDNILLGDTHATTVQTSTIQIIGDEEDVHVELETANDDINEKELSFFDSICSEETSDENILESEKTKVLGLADILKNIDEIDNYFLCEGENVSFFTGGLKDKLRKSDKNATQKLLTSLLLENKILINE